MSESDQLKEFRKEFPNGGWWEYQCWCGEKFFAEQDAALLKHADRNTKVINHLAYQGDLLWFLDYVRRKPKSIWRGQVSDEIFDAIIKVDGIHNRLMMELSREELDADVICIIIE